MKKGFSFTHPIHMYKVMGFDHKPASIGFFKTYLEAHDAREMLGLDAISTCIDTTIKTRCAESGIFDERKINEELEKYFDIYMFSSAAFTDKQLEIMTDLALNEV